MRSPAEELAAIDRADMRRRRRVLDSAQGVRVRADGRDYLSFCSNDYLGLASDPRIAAAAIDALQRHGVGAGASHLVSGHHRLHGQLEESLAAHVGMSRAVLFGSGYLANLAIVTCLATRSTEVFADRLNHASLNDAMVLSRAKFRRYAHCDVDALDAMLAQSRAAEKVVVTDAVFSMDGDIAPLPAILQTCERHDAWLVVDDAHGLGVLGKKGAGSLAHFGIDDPRIAYVGTLGKAAGVSGAFVAGATDLVELLIQRARSYVYTTASPPALAAALLESMQIIRDEEWRRERLARLIARFSGKMVGRSWRLLASPTPIQPLIVGENAAAVALAGSLESRGILAPAIRPPTVPRGSARIRFSLSAAHSDEDIDLLVERLRAAEDGVQ